MGGWEGVGGVNNVLLDIHLHDLFLLIVSFLPSFIHPSFIHSFIRSFILSLIHSFIQQSKAACTTEKVRAQPSKSKRVDRRANSACTAEAPPHRDPFGFALLFLD